MKTLILAVCLSGNLWAGEVVYSTSTLQIVETGVGDKSRFIGDQNYAITEVSDAEIQVDGNLNNLVYDPSTNTIKEKPRIEIDRIDRIEKKNKIVSLKTQLRSLQAVRSNETDEETKTIIDDRIGKIQETIIKLE